MKVLVKLEQLLFWTFLFQDKPYKLRSIQIPYLILNFICAVPLLALIVLMNHRIYLVISNDGSFDDISYEAYMNLGATTTTLSYFSYVQNIPLIILIIQSTQTIVRKRVDESNHGIYGAAEDKFEKLMRKIYSFDLLVLITIFTVPSLAPIATDVFGFEGLRKLWIIPLPVAAWWDITNLFGYYLLIIIQILSSVSYLGSITIMITFIIGICTYINGAVDDLAFIMNTIDQNAISKSNSTQNRVNSKLFLYKFIELHLEFLNIFRMFATLTSGPIFFQLIVYTASIALNLLRFERTFNELNFSAIPNLNTLLIQILFNYVICSYASNVSAKLSSVSDIVYNSFWYKYPAELQKLLPLLTQRSQTPYIITGYGIINCSLDTFLLLIRSATSYFVVFRNFTH